MKKSFLFLEFLFVVFVFIAPANTADVETTRFDLPLLITSAGQSAEVQLASVLAKRAGLDYSMVKMASAEDLSNVKTLALVIGASLKGLGAAGLDVAQEKERVSSLVKAIDRIAFGHEVIYYVNIAPTVLS